jgi:hypothetical protein
LVKVVEVDFTRATSSPTFGRPFRTPDAKRRLDTSLDLLRGVDFSNFRDV